jgi:DNA-directed DNA polymerase III PolC
MHLDAKSWYSFHCGVAAPSELCQQAAEQGHPALGIADTDGTYGLITHYYAAIECGIKPLLGIALTDPQVISRHDYAGDPTLTAAVVIARNRQGYSQLCQLATERQLAERFNLATALKAHTEHCFVCTDRPDLLESLHGALGPRRLYVSATPLYSDQERPAQIRQVKLARRFKLGLAACTDVCFVKPQDQSVHRVMRAIGQAMVLELAQGVRCRSHYLAAPSELTGYYYDLPEALANAHCIADQCEVEFSEGQWQFPQYQLPGGMSAERALYELCQRGLRWRFGSRGCNSQHQARLEMELGVIAKLGYTSYFLFVHDIVTEARRRRIPHIGRGSAANSLVSYLLGLTPVDPLAYNLIFERFLNPERTSPPDIDIDFAWDERDAILQFVYDRWGSSRVALISTHVTYRGRSALREVAKTFGLSDEEISQVNRQLPYMNAGRLAQKIAQQPEMRGIDLTVEPYRYILPLATRLENRPRHLGIHCGGIVITPGPLTDYTGLQRAAKGFVVTQYEMRAVEKIGLIKIDLLGNRSLAVLKDTLAAMEARGVQAPVHDFIATTRDSATVNLIRSGNSMGCFYIESPAMRALLKQLGSRTFEDVTAASSVIRPGVAQSGMMDEYIRRRRGELPKLSTHPLLLKLLPETCGVMVYQEDVIRVAVEAAGFSQAQADMLRRATSGKLRGTEGMNAVREHFITGCLNRGLDSASALEIWRQLSSFSGYSFCKAHSASFATLSFQVAYLKAHHPADFMAAVLSNGGGFYGPRAYLSECQRLGLEVLPPDVNHSLVAYCAEAACLDAAPDAVRVGLMVIKNVRDSLKRRIVEQRLHGGRYVSLRDFIRRTGVQSAELEVLILAGALDSLGGSRPQLLWAAKLAPKARQPVAVQQGWQPGLLAETDTATLPVSLEDIDDYSPEEMLLLELEHCGMLIRQHPLQAWADRSNGCVKSTDLYRCVGKQVRLLGWCIATKRVSVTNKPAPDNLLALLAEHPDLPEAIADDSYNAAAELGIIHPSGVNPSQIYSPGSRSMKFMSMEDLYGTYEVTLFPNAYQRYAPLTQSAGPFIVSGRVEERFGVCSVNCTQLVTL